MNVCDRPTTAVFKPQSVSSPHTFFVIHMLAAVWILPVLLFTFISQSKSMFLHLMSSIILLKLHWILLFSYIHLGKNVIRNIWYFEKVVKLILERKYVYIKAFSIIISIYSMISYRFFFKCKITSCLARMLNSISQEIFHLVYYLIRVSGPSLSFPEDFAEVLMSLKNSTRINRC